jgi:hypothetical protein
MIVTVSREKTYIPQWNGNRDLPPGEQVVAHYKAGSFDLRSRLLPDPQVKFSYDKDGNPTGGSGEVSLDKKGIVRGMLIRIDNLSVEVKGEIEKVISANDLFSGPFEELIDELADVFRKELKKEISAKN